MASNLGEHQLWLLDMDAVICSLNNKQLSFRDAASDEFRVLCGG